MQRGAVATATVGRPSAPRTGGRVGATMGVGARPEVRAEEMEAPVVDAAGRIVVPRRVRIGLSGRLFLLTVGFVGLTEILIYVPAVANYRRAWLSDRLAAAQVATLVLDAAPEGHVSDELARRLLVGSGARAIAARDGETRRLLTLDTMPDEVGDTVDLRKHAWTDAIRGAARTLVVPTQAPIRVIGYGQDGFDLVEILIDEAPLRAALVTFSVRLLTVSLVIAAVAAGLVFSTLQHAIVRPVRRLANNIAAFADAPEQADRVIKPSDRTDEIGHAEIALARMEVALAGELRQKRRLAELGLSVSKINHELRNLLTTAQLLSDRLEGVADPLVQRVAPRLVGTLDRAIRYCEATLAYGRAGEPPAQRHRVALAPLLAELPDLAGRAPDSPVAVRASVAPDIQVDADPEQLLRALTNLVRNAVQALEAMDDRDPERSVTIAARREFRDGGMRVVILVTDTGPGLPERAREYLFAPFQGSMRAGGTGLGLAIASELVRLNGGTLDLDRTAPGTQFGIVIPDRPA